MNKFIDLHMHSLYSDDGEFSPSELVRKCKDKGIRIMAIADHNSVRGVHEAKEVAKTHGIQYITGIEIDCTYKAINLHILGYGIDTTGEDFIKIEENVIQQELKSSRKKLELTNQLGFNIHQEDLDKLSSNGIYTGEMFAEVLLNDVRYRENELLKPYRREGIRSDNPYVNFYWDYYAKDKPCYTEIIYPTLEETLGLIKKNGGVAVLAHPGQNLKGHYEVFDELVTKGIQGVEVFSNYHDEETIRFFLDKGKSSHLLITCGSDYHGKTKSAIELGETRCTINEYEIEQQLKQIGLIKKY